MSPLADRSQRLFIVLASVFVANAMLAELIGVKIFAPEDTLGMQPLPWHLFGRSGSLNFTVGVLLWPLVFVMTDVINEFFGQHGVRLISWLTVALIGYRFVFAYIARLAWHRRHGGPLPRNRKAYPIIRQLSPPCLAKVCGLLAAR